MNLRGASPADVETLFDIRCSVRENHQSGFYRHLGWRHDGYLEDGQLRFTKEL
jgi:hypothetical protein